MSLSLIGLLSRQLCLPWTFKDSLRSDLSVSVLGATRVGNRGPFSNAGKLCYADTLLTGVALCFLVVNKKTFQVRISFFSRLLFLWRKTVSPCKVELDVLRAFEFVFG